jgi:hypothetical protein
MAHVAAPVLRQGVHEVASILCGTGAGALSAAALGTISASVGAVYGGISTASYVVIDKALECLLGDSAIAKVIRIALSLIGSTAIGVAATTALLGVTFVIADAIVLTLAMIVTLVVAPIIVQILSPSIPCLPCLTCCLFV